VAVACAGGPSSQALAIFEASNFQFGAGVEYTARTGNASLPFQLRLALRQIEPSARAKDWRKTVPPGSGSSLPRA